MSEEHSEMEVAHKAKRMSTAAERQEWLRRYRESGLRIRQFCDEHKLVLNTFYQWRASERLEWPAARVPSGSEPAFTEVKLEALNTPCIWAAELQRPNGIILRVGANLPVALLEQLLRVC